MKKKTVLFLVLISNLVASMGTILHAPSGLSGLGVYILFLSFFFIVFPHALRKLPFLSDKKTYYALLVILCILPALSIPLTFSGKLPLGTSRNVGLTAAGNELLNGRYPYKPLIPFNSIDIVYPDKPYAWLDYTKDGVTNGPEPLTALGGSILLSLPFTLIFGYCGYQNILWLIILSLIVSSIFKKDGLFVILSIFVFHANFVREFLSGSDYFANSIFILFSILMVKKLARMDVTPLIIIGGGIMAGLFLSSRVIFFPLMLLFFIQMFKYSKSKSIIFSISLMITVVLATIPFYLWSPEWYSPLHVLRFSNRFDGFIPHFSMVVNGLVLMALLISSWMILKSDDDNLLLLSSAVIVALPIFSFLIMNIVCYGDIGPYSNFLLPVSLVFNFYLFSKSRIHDDVETAPVTA